MLSFENDYSEGAHEKILQKFMETNLEQMSGYGNDPYSESAKGKIRAACNCPEADVYFLTGGTQTNKTIIDSVLKPYEGVISAASGHISVHEAGAVEFTGHKVLTVAGVEGKLEAGALEQFIEDFLQTETMSIWYFRGWYTFRILRSMGRFTAKRNCRLYMQYVRHTRSRCL